MIHFFSGQQQKGREGALLQHSLKEWEGGFPNLRSKNLEEDEFDIFGADRICLAEEGGRKRREE